MGLLKEHQLTKPSVVADLSLPTAKDEDVDKRSSGEVERAKAKGDAGVDSVAVALGTKASNFSLPNDQTNNIWQAV
jgi:hypothetical protein